MHRRDFLDLRHAAHGHSAPEASPADVSLIRLGWRAMATRFEVVAPAETPDALAAGRDVFALLDRLEDQMTVYRDGSEICRVNRLAARRPVRVENGLFDLLAVARRVWEETDGAFDVSAHALVKAWGGFRGPRRVPAEAERLSALGRVGMARVTLDVEKKTVHFAREGIELNLGSIGKGYALDRMAQRLRGAWGFGSCLLHGGGSSNVGVGHPPGEPRGWPVRLRHPWRADHSLGTVWLRDRALGTSAATFRHLVHEGRKLGHTLDPRTGWPASGLDSVSVVAPTAALADALSTAFYVGGAELAQRYCQAHPDVAAVLLPQGAERPLAFNQITLASSMGPSS